MSMIGKQFSRFAAVLALLGATVAAADAGNGHGRHPDGGYGVNGGVNEVYSQANVFSGIYGLRYTDDRAHYDFEGCRARNIGDLDPADPAIGPCR